MYLSWWLIAPLLLAVVVLFKMVSRLSREVDKLEGELEESKGKVELFRQYAHRFKLVNLKMAAGLAQIRTLSHNMASGDEAEKARLLAEIDEALKRATEEEPFIDRQTLNAPAQEAPTERKLQPQQASN
ncbi:hypothetical protein ACBV55_19715 [Franconibacter pulveris]